jgi:hypothetical protein
LKETKPNLLVVILLDPLSLSAMIRPSTRRAPFITQFSGVSMRLRLARS